MARSVGPIYIADNSVVAINDALQQLMFLIDEVRGEHDNSTIPVGPHTHNFGGGTTDQDGGPIVIPPQTIDHDDLTNVTSDQHHAKLHSSTHGPGGVDALKLDNLDTPDDNTDLDSQISQHGLLRKLDNNSTHFLDGQGNWSAVVATSTEANDVANVEGCETTPIWELINTGPGITMIEGTDHDGVELNARPDPKYAIEWDDFLSGATTTLQIGKLGWGAVSGHSIITSESNHPGIAQISGSGATAMFLNNSNVGVLHTGDLFDLTVIVRPDTTSAATYRFGFFNNQASTSNPPTDGIYFEYIGGTDSFWNGVCRSGSSTTKSPTAVAPGASTWATLRVRRHDSTTIAFSVDGGAEIFISATVPSSAAVMVFQVVPSSGTHNFNIDWMSLVINVTR